MEEGRIFGFQGSLTVNGENDPFLNSVIGEPLNFSRDEEENDFLREVVGDDSTIDNSGEGQSELIPQQTAEFTEENTNTQPESVHERHLQEMNNSFYVRPVSSQYKHQRPMTNMSFGGEAQNMMVNSGLTHQQYATQPLSQGYHQETHGILRNSQHNNDVDGSVGHHSHQQFDQRQYLQQQQQQNASAHWQQQLHDQMLAKQLMENGAVQQSERMMRQHVPPERLYSESSVPTSHQHNRQRSDVSTDVIELVDDGSSSSPAYDAPKRQRLDVSDRQIHSQGQDPAVMSYVARNHNMPQWMNGSVASQHVHRPNHQSNFQTSSGANNPRDSTYGRPQIPSSRQCQPIMREIPEGHVSTWESPLPLGIYRMARGPRRFELSLINVKEFTITGLPTGYDKPPSSLDGLRKTIKEISKDHGVAVYERAKEGGPGRWRIPLGAYSSFFAYLNNDPSIQVKGIPLDQLKIASLGKARLEKGYPSVKRLINIGVPKGLATALAPFQRGGVDFVVEKKGRALIADEMGLGKTVQGIASMSVYHDDWPLLVLTPSSARYHWENEFQQWLGRDSRVNSEGQCRVNLAGESDGEEEDDDEVVDESNCMTLLEDTQIHVLTSGKDDILPTPRTKVVICSYGLAPALAVSGKLYPGLFRSAIVDESHMLKNMNTKRTKNLVPILSATNRCVLLSGTPALAKPSELWPQLKILNTANTGWLEEEHSFHDKYVKNSSALRRAELHAILTGTVMIRRLKHDILKSLPKKFRGRAIVDVCSPEMKSEFHQCMAILREGKGQLGTLAKQHSALGTAPIAPPEPSRDSLEFERAKAAIEAEQRSKYNDRLRQIDYALASSRTTLDAIEQEQWRRQAIEILERELEVWYQERMHELNEEIPQPEGEFNKKSVLNRMYSLTGKAKIPMVSSMIKKWLMDSTKGKLCVFAHHIFVLDELERLCELSNQAGSTSMYIRIDGSTSPKERQAQIKNFQTDPRYRIAILGITAAGVAVTLTASSTVWFTELFWTPALMIQAEDRCHRIGQNSRVQCLYFVASGTLDDLLWKLLEKKFRELGEFVEGMEKQKIVVHKTYHGKNDLDAMFNVSGPDDEDDELDLDEESDTEEGGRDIIGLEHDLRQDIELLGREELTMMRADGDDDDEDGAEERALEKGKNESTPGSTENEAILLSDDEEDSKKDSPSKHDREGGKRSGDGEEPGTIAGKSGGKIGTTKAPEGFDIRRPLAGCCAYSVIFEGESYGMKLFTFRGRVVVGQILNRQYDLPRQYAVVVGVNGQPLPMLNDLGQIMTFMKVSLDRGPVELLFVEIPDLIIECKRLEAEKVRTRRRQQAAAKKEQTASQEATDVIELLDDD